MLKVHRVSGRYKCPRHPNQQYDNPGAVPASCEACHAIAAVQAALVRLGEAERRAYNWLARAGLARERAQ